MRCSGRRRRACRRLPWHVPAVRRAVARHGDGAARTMLFRMGPLVEAAYGAATLGVQLHERLLVRVEEERQLDVLHVRVEEEELGQRVAHGVPLDDVGYLRAQRAGCGGIAAAPLCDTGRRAAPPARRRPRRGPGATCRSGARARWWCPSGSGPRCRAAPSRRRPTPPRRTAPPRAATRRRSRSTTRGSPRRRAQPRRRGAPRCSAPTRRRRPPRRPCPGSR